MAFKLLLTDTGCPLGKALSHRLERETFTLVQPRAGEVDWGNAQAVKAFVAQCRPNIIVNTLGWGQPFDTQQQSLLVNASWHLAAACVDTEICPIHLSSHLVFGGENKTAYDESDPPRPLDAAGRAHLAAENAFAEQLRRFIILRLSWVVSVEGDNLLTQMLRALSRDLEVSASTRRRGAPTFSDDVARVLVAQIKQVLCGAENWGVMHYCSGDACTEAEFAQRISDSLKRQGHVHGKVHKYAEAEEETVASAVLSGRRCRDNFGIQAHSWRQGLPAAVRLWVAVVLHNQSE